MASTITMPHGSGEARIFTKPLTEDPFINCRLISLGADQDQVERFAISSLNNTTGARTLVVNENGQHRAYAWPDDCRPAYVYGAVGGANADTLWLGGRSNTTGLCLYRLTLSSGAVTHYPVPAGHFITSGMAYDPGTKKLFTGCGSAMVSFDTERETIARAYSQEEMGPSHFHHGHWRNRDGTYGFLLATPGLTYVRWFPLEERIAVYVLTADPRHPALRHVLNGPYQNPEGVYVPHMGWLNGLTGDVTPHPHPPRDEASWMGAIGPFVYGVQGDRCSGDSRLMRWDPTTGAVKSLLTLPDQPQDGVALTRRGCFLAVGLHGLIRRIRADNGALELTKKCEHRDAHVGHVVCPAGEDRVVGTPFICQNFWVLNTRTGNGYDAGRAAGSYGQIDAALTVNGKVYFTAYGGAQLTEFDPERPANWPRNPRLVAKSDQGQHGAGMATDGNIVWVAFRPLYGTLDGAMIRYDTQTGEATYRNAAIENQHVLYPMWDADTEHLVAGTSFLSDCGTAVPVCDTVYAVTLDPVSLEVIQRAPAPPGLEQLVNAGPLGAQKWLMREGNRRVCVFDQGANTFSTDWEALALPEGTADLLYAGTPGHFVAVSSKALQLWDVNRDTLSCIAEFPEGFVYRACVHGRSLYCDCVHKVAVLENVLP